MTDVILGIVLIAGSFFGLGAMVGARAAQHIARHSELVEAKQ